MTERTTLTTVDDVHEAGSWLFTVVDEYGVEDEAILVPCDGGVEAWLNRCTHQAFRLDHGSGVTYREGEITCVKHGSTFDTCSGYCDNGDAADSTLASVDVECVNGDVLLVDDAYAFVSKGQIDDDGDVPGTSIHLEF